MEASGIIRRVDSLGRIVIPKEVRQALGIQTGDSLEVGLTPDNQITLSKHSWLKEMEGPAKDLCRTLQRTCGRAAAVTDREHVLAAYGFGGFRLKGESISNNLRRVIESRSAFQAMEGRNVAISEQFRDMSVQLAVPIIVHGESSGCVLLAQPWGQYTRGQYESDIKVLTALSSVIGSYLSN